MGGKEAVSDGKANTRFRFKGVSNTQCTSGRAWKSPVLLQQTAGVGCVRLKQQVWDGAPIMGWVQKANEEQKLCLQGAEPN